MVYAKRLVLCLVLGLITGFICYQGGKCAYVPFTTGLAWGTILNRTFIGFAIGISAWRMHFLLHGIILGILGSLPMAVAAPNCSGFWALVIFGAIWGFLIELLATLVFKAPMKTAQLS